MNKLSKLNEFDILDLLNEYHSEMRKLQHKIAFVREKIQTLENELVLIQGSRQVSYTHAVEDVDQPKVEIVEEEPKAVEPTPTKAKPTPKVKTLKKRGRKMQPLSVWDRMIYDSIAENGRAILSRDILVLLIEKARAAGLFEDEDHARIKLNQCLVKMTSDRRKDLLKLKHEGRGYAYALPEWVDENGKALPEFKLRLKKEGASTKVKKAKKVVAEKPKRKRISKPAPQASSGTPEPLTAAIEPTESVVSEQSVAENLTETQE